jgi:nucleotide-binding universal stress UspA family protein
MDEIVAGVDGSESSIAALRWAFREAGRRGWGLRAVLATGSSDTHGSNAGTRVDPNEARDEIGVDLDRIVDDALGDDAHAVRREVVAGRAAPALLAAARGSALLVLGSRGLGGFRGLLLGSVTTACLEHAACPVAVVREGHEATDPVRRIVVGVDGSAEATAALQWAYETATLHDASVEIVGAWTFPVVSYERMAATPLNPAPFEDVARSAIEKSIAAAGTTTVTDVERTVAFGSPAAVILRAAQHAQLVVVGSRGLGPFAGWVLGSVSRQVAQHASCPVVVTPTAR